MRRRLHGAVFVLALTLASAGARAQQTWIVDPTGVGNFTDLASAIAGAGPGDTLILRGGNYPSSYVVNKALNLIGDSPRPRVGTLSWTSLPASSPAFTLAGFDLVSARMFIAYNAPPQTVSFDDMTVARVRFGSNWTASLTNCTLGGRFDHYGVENRDDGLSLAASDVVVSNCVIDGGNGFGFWQGLAGCQAFPGGYAVHCVGGDLTITGSTLRGPSSVPVALCGGIMSAAAQALYINGGTVRVTQSTLAGGTSAYPVPVPAVSMYWPTSIFEFDSSTQFTPANTVGVLRFLPGTGGQGAPPGGTMICRVESGPNLPAVLVAGIGLRGPTATPFGPAWVDPAAYVVLVIGFTDPVGVLNTSISLPGWLPRGLPITVQSVVAPGAAAGLVAGAPVVLHVL